jgi:hypothetical protein
MEEKMNFPSSAGGRDNKRGRGLVPEGLQAVLNSIFDF